MRPIEMEICLNPKQVLKLNVFISRRVTPYIEIDRYLNGNY